MTGQRSGKANPDCPKCEGRGAIFTSNGFLQLNEALGPWPETWKTRCACTDIPSVCGTITAEETD